MNFYRLTILLNIFINKPIGVTTKKNIILITIGEIIAFILFIQMMFRPIRQLADRFNVLQMGIVGSERVFRV